MKSYDFKKEWPNIKKQLIQMGQEALTLAKKGEKQILNFSKEGKLYLDSTSKELKKEKLYYLIGKAYVKAGCPGEKNASLKKLVEQFRQLEKERKTIKRKLKRVQK